jgi:hypothetical protein
MTSMVVVDAGLSVVQPLPSHLPSSQDLINSSLSILFSNLLTVMKRTLHVQVAGCMTDSSTSVSSVSSRNQITETSTGIRNHARLIKVVSKIIYI